MTEPSTLETLEAMLAAAEAEVAMFKAAETMGMCLPGAAQTAEQRVRALEEAIAALRDRL